MSRYTGNAVYALLVYLSLTSVAAADFASCGKSTDELQQFRSGKSYIELAAAYVEDCAANSQLAGEGQVFLARIRNADDASRANAVRDTMVFLISRFSAQFDAPNSANASAINAMRQGLECTKRSLESQEALDAANCDQFPSEDGTVDLQQWWPRADEGPVFTDSFVTPFGDCAGEQVGSDASCDEQFNTGFLPVLEYQSFMHSQVRPIANQQPAEQIEAYYSASHERWKSYLADTGFQYPWELTFNR